MNPFALSLACLAGLVAPALGASPLPEIVRALAPTGKLRAAINYGNPVLAQSGTSDAEPRGVSADLARALGQELGVPLEFVSFHEAGEVSASSGSGRWDVCFLAIDPVRGKGLDFTAPYVLIEGTYLVPKGSPLQSIDEVDRPGTRVAVATGSAYDLFLSRALKDATLLRAPNGAATYPMIADGGAEVVAGVREPLTAYAAAHPEVRVMSGRFMSIEQAMCVPKGRPEALPYLRSFVEARKASGFVATALAASGQTSATVAPSVR